MLNGVSNGAQYQSSLRVTGLKDEYKASNHVPTLPRLRFTTIPPGHCKMTSSTPSVRLAVPSNHHAIVRVNEMARSIKIIEGMGSLTTGTIAGTTGELKSFA